MSNLRTSCILLVLMGCGDPEVATGGNRLATISGTIIVSRPAQSDGCIDASASGPAMLFLFHAENPPPPTGTGSPVSFVLVPESELFPPGAVLADGDLFQADFVFPNISPGRYIISGFLDADNDFNPAVPFLAQASAGDILGGYVDDAGAFLELVVEEPVAIDQVAVRLGQALPLEAPAFLLSQDSILNPTRATQALSLQSVALDVIGMQRDCTRFLVRYPEGVAADNNQDGVEDVLPRVVFTQVGIGDETQVRVEGIVDPRDLSGDLALGVATPVLSVIVTSTAAVTDSGGVPSPSAVPGGSYAVTVIGATGQTWTVPNEIPQVLPDSEDARTQAQVLRIDDL